MKIIVDAMPKTKPSCPFYNPTAPIKDRCCLSREKEPCELHMTKDGDYECPHLLGWMVV